MLTPPSPVESFGVHTPFSEPAWYTLPSPYYTDVHRRLRVAIRAWVEEHLMEQAPEWDEAHTIDPATYAQAAKDGLLLPMFGGASIPADWTKHGKIIAGIKPEEWDGFCELIMIDELRRVGCGGVPSGLFTGGQYGAPLLYKYGSQSLQDKYLPDILSGKKRICLALTEPSAGSDVKNLSTSAVRSSDGKHWIVNGGKKWITNGIWSDFFATAVRTRGAPGDANGISILLIPRTEGVKTTQMKTSGNWASGTTQLTFDDVLVPIENLIGTENEGLRCVLHNFNHERLAIAIAATRSARVCLEEAMTHATTRIVYGKPLMDLGVIRYKLGNMARVVEGQQAWVESLVYQLQHLSSEDGNRLLGGQTSLLKAHCGIVLEFCAREAVQVLGGLGFTRGGRGDKVERMWREVKSVTVAGGSEEVMLDLAIRQQVKLAMRLSSKL